MVVLRNSVLIRCTPEEAFDHLSDLHAEFTPRPHGWFRLIFPLFLLVIGREEKANMIHLRTALERRSQARR